MECETPVSPPPSLVHNQCPLPLLHIACPPLLLPPVGFQAAKPPSATEREVAENHMRDAWLSAPFEAELLKFTNVVKGWQPRWIKLDPVHGVISYYLHSSDAKPRGILRLNGATVYPSLEDPLVFAVQPSTSNADPLKLKAANTYQKQEWINRIRLVAEDVIQRKKKQEHCIPTPVATESVRAGTSCELPVMWDLDRLLNAGADQEMTLQRITDELPLSDKETLKEALVLKANAKALLTEIDRCAVVLRHMASEPRHSRHKRTASSDMENFEFEDVADGLEVASDAVLTIKSQLDEIQPNTEFPDEEDHSDEPFDSIEPFKAIILALHSHLKLGMDLTKVNLPTFILQSRSFLESLSNHFLPISVLLDPALSESSSPANRFLQVVKWYVASMYFGFQGGLAKKPYNPILGEVFRCTWLTPSSKGNREGDRVTFIAEQVSHHPPCSAFYAECPAREVYVWGHVYMQGKYTGSGMSLQCCCKGELVVHFGGTLSETYRFTPYPSAHAKSFVTNPWMELVGRVSVTCEKTDLYGNVTFPTSPFYSGSVHRFTGEIKSKPPGSDDDIAGPGHEKLLYRLQGAWNEKIEVLQDESIVGTAKIPDDFPEAVRLIRLAEDQHPRESRRLWREVTTALRAGDLERASVEKLRLEEAQRAETVLLKKRSISYNSQYFVQKQDGSWVYSGCPSLELT